jgi:hypothetical protein
MLTRDGLMKSFVVSDEHLRPISFQVIPAQAWSKQFWQLVCCLVLEPSKIGFNIGDVEIMMNLPEQVRCFYPMPAVGDFQRTNSKFAKSEQKYPVDITLAYAHIVPSGQCLSESVDNHQRDIFRKKLTKFDLWSPSIEPWYPGVV